MWHDSWWRRRFSKRSPTAALDNKHHFLFSEEKNFFFRSSFKIQHFYDLNLSIKQSHFGTKFLLNLDMLNDRFRRFCGVFFHGEDETREAQWSKYLLGCLAQSQVSFLSQNGRKRILKKTCWCQRQFKLLPQIWWCLTHIFQKNFWYNCFKMRESLSKISKLQANLFFLWWKKWFHSSMWLQNYKASFLLCPDFGVFYILLSHFDWNISCQRFLGLGFFT